MIASLSAARHVMSSALSITSGSTNRLIKGNSFFKTIRQFSVTNTTNMKFCQFTHKSNFKPQGLRAGFLLPSSCGPTVVDINNCYHGLPPSMLEILRNGDMEKVKCLQMTNPDATPIYDVNIKAPVTGMDKVICIGLNYKDHCEEQNVKLPEIPMFFSKFASCVIGASDSVKLRTDVTSKVDWEAELAVVIGKETSNVTPETALNYVFGYTCAQDISARDWQKEKNGGQFLLGKAMDTFCPLGPCIVTPDEICDPECLEIRCSVNGVLKQNSSTGQLIHKIPDAIARLSSVMTLLPGDVILTGTPGGVGMYRDPPEWLQPGDVITTEILGIGLLETKVETYNNKNKTVK